MESPMRSFLRVLTYNDNLGWCLNAVAFLCMVASGALLPLMDILFGRVITVYNNFATGIISPTDFRSQIGHYSLWFIYLFTAKFVLTYVWNVLISVTAIRATRNLRVNFLQQTLSQEISYFDSPDASSISGQITTNASLVSSGLSEKLGLIIQAASTFVTAFVVAFAVQWKLSLIVVGIVPTSLVVTMVCLGIDTKYENETMKFYAKAGLHAEEVFSSIRNVHAFWAYRNMSERYESILQNAYIVGRKKSPILSILYSFEFFCIYSGYGLAFWQGIRRYASGEIDEPGKVVTVIFAILVAAQALTQVAPQIVHISKAAAAAHELFQIIDRRSEVDPLSTNGIQPDFCHGNIAIRNVSFSYPSRPNVPILKDFTLNVPSNKTTALVGASGSGKSTIVGLLERWYAPSAGNIKVDGHNIEEFNVQWLRSNIRLVQQEPVLFRGTIFQNVEHGLTLAQLANLSKAGKETLVREACKAAFAHEFILNLPNGYDTEVGQRGGMLSGGQKQRIAIARSIISNPRILLLDEATSALDPKAEHIVQKALDNVAANRTMIVIAHRLSTIRRADNIVVMSQGEIVEQGTHDHLIAQGGHYARLVRAQQLDKNREGSHEQRSEESVQVTEEKQILPEEPTSKNETPILQADHPPKHSLVKSVTLVIKEQRSLWGVFIVTFGCCLIAGLTYPALAIVFSLAVDSFHLQGSELVDRGDFFSLMFFIIALANLGVYAVFGWASNTQAQHIVKTYRLKLFNSLMRQDMRFFDESSNSTGALVSRLSTEPQNIMELMSMNIGMVLVNMINVISSCLLAIAFGWKLGLVLTFGALPPLLGAGYLRIRLESKLEEDHNARFAESAGQATEATMAIRTVASLAIERQIIDRFRHTLEDVAEKSIKALGWNMFWYALSQSISFLAMALGFWYGGRLVSTGEYTSAQFYTIFIAIIFSGEAAAMFFQFTTSITRALIAINYIFAVVSQVKPEMNDDDVDTKPETTISQGPMVEMEKVRFAYPQQPQIQILHGINIMIPAGSFVAFVGPSGCGKSTMIGLLERFYEPASGKIMIDGQKSTAKRLGQYRFGIALVQQEPVLYQGSIRDNIALGLPTTTPPSEEAVMAAATAANIHDFILSLPEGLNTPCGALGLQLSGGQRQRIAIARALIRNSRLLLLDEATSALDTESEQIVKAALKRASTGRTTIAVAHRLSTVQDADCIYVFSEGRVIEAGSHTELMGQKGTYYEMCVGQSLGSQ